MPLWTLLRAWRPELPQPSLCICLLRRPLPPCGPLIVLVSLDLLAMVRGQQARSFAACELARVRQSYAAVLAVVRVGIAMPIGFCKACGFWCAHRMCTGLGG